MQEFNRSSLGRGPSSPIVRFFFISSAMLAQKKCEKELIYTSNAFFIVRLSAR